MYLPPDDRPHYVCWSDETKEAFTPKYWNGIWGWYNRESGLQHVATYLRALDISKFDPKAPPPKTAAFWAIVDASRAPEDAELQDVLDAIENPDAVTLTKIITYAQGGLLEWLTDRKNRRTFSHRMEACGYVRVRNDTAKDGLWKINDKRK